MIHLRLKRVLACSFLMVVAMATSNNAMAYPYDGVDVSGIKRLLADVNGKQPPGARLASEQIRLHLLDYPALRFDQHPADKMLADALANLLKNRDPSYALVMVDFSNPSDIRWAGLQPDLRQNPGSVGKVVCMLALFDALAEAFPAIEDRQRILRTTMVPAGAWVKGDSHDVPHFDAETGKNRGAVLKPDDVFALSEWIDHAVSASANGAGSVIWREAMLLQHFGARYPVSPDERDAFFKKTPKSTLSALGKQVIANALTDAGLDTEALMQGSFWTATSKALVPGGQSYATPRELARFMFRMEQGRLVDVWSSLEMKKYMYLTKRRYRYVYAPELSSLAVYFKSGSLYQCQPEEGFRCGKYLGNVRNLMNSVTTIESPPDSGAVVHYTAALMSNVLRLNSAWDHSRIAAAVHQLITTQQPVKLKETDSEAVKIDAGKSN